MSKFQITKRISLDFIGDGWNNAYAVFNSLSIVETQELAKQGKNFTDKDNVEQQTEATNFVLNILEGKFIEGKGWNGKELVNIEKEDLKDLPPKFIEQAMLALSGSIEKKS